MQFQDWNVIILRKKEDNKVNPINEKHKNNLTLITTEKHKNKNDNSNKFYKINNDDNIVSNYIPTEISKKIQHERTIKNIKRKDLAIMLNIKENIITELENGKYYFDKLLIRKIEKVLNCKIL